jgi:hypothetical protein
VKQKYIKTLPYTEAWQDIEALLRADAGQTRPITHEKAREALIPLAPAIAAGASRLSMRRKKRREALVMVVVGAPMLTLMLLAGLDALRGGDTLRRALFAACGFLSAAALLTAPLLERFGARIDQNTQCKVGEESVKANGA